MNFIGIDQIVFEYSQLKVSNLLKSRIIIKRVKVKQIITKQTEKPCYPMTEAPHANEKAQVITVINDNL